MLGSLLALVARSQNVSPNAAVRVSLYSNLSGEIAPIQIIELQTSDLHQLHHRRNRQPALAHSITHTRGSLLKTGFINP